MKKLVVLWWATCALACADCYELKVTTPLRPLAVGATFEARFQYAKSFDCTPDQFSRCRENIGLNFIESISSVEVDDASLFEVNVPLTGDTFSVKALREGQTSITVNGLDVKGARQSASAQFRALQADRAELSHLCVPADAGVLLPASTEVFFNVDVLQGTTSLLATGLDIPFESGALTQVPDAGAFTLLTPGFATNTVLATTLGQRFELPVGVYMPDQLDGVVLQPTRAGPYAVGSFVVVAVTLKAGGATVCRAPEPPPVKTVSVLDGGCSFTNGNDSAAPDIDSPQVLTDQQSVFVRSRSAGVCQLEVSVPDAGSDLLELTFGP